MKKTILFSLLFILTCFISFSQGSDTTSKTEVKRSQALLKNEVYGGYGEISVYFFLGKFHHKSFIYRLDPNLNVPGSSGIILFGYNRSLDKVTSIGLLVAYERFHSTGTVRFSAQSGGWSLSPVIADDELVTGIASLSFNYVNKPSFSLYTRIEAGVTLDYSKQELSDWGEKYYQREVFPAGQFTVLGIRFGGKLGGFIEAGFGTLGIVNAGLSYKFKDKK